MIHSENITWPVKFLLKKKYPFALECKKTLFNEFIEILLWIRCTYKVYVNVHCFRLLITNKFLLCIYVATGK